MRSHLLLTGQHRRRAYSLSCAQSCSEKDGIPIYDYVNKNSSGIRETKAGFKRKSSLMVVVMKPKEIPWEPVVGCKDFPARSVRGTFLIPESQIFSLFRWFAFSRYPD